jgi:hypothetical protein
LAGAWGGKIVNFQNWIFMKTSCLFFVAIIAPLTIFCQKHDNNWVQGTGLTDEGPFSETMLVTFDNSPPTIATWPVTMNFRATTLTVSDKEGNLIFFTNGIQVHDANDELMLGGDSLNAGQLAYENWHTGYSAYEGIQALPIGDDIYYLFRWCTKCKAVSY